VATLRTSSSEMPIRSALPPITTSRGTQSRPRVQQHRHQRRGLTGYFSPALKPSAQLRREDDMVSEFIASAPAPSFPLPCPSLPRPSSQARSRLTQPSVLRQLQLSLASVLTLPVNLRALPFQIQPIIPCRTRIRFSPNSTSPADFHSIHCAAV